MALSIAAGRWRGLGLVLLTVAATATALAAAPGEPGPAPAELAESLRATERAFAATVRDKDLEAFASFLSAGAVFNAGRPLRGKDAIVEGWTGLFAADAATLLWEPCVVEVEGSGRIGFTRGPYWFGGAEGEEVPRGTFLSVWERQDDGGWKILLDTGVPGEPGPPIESPCSPAPPLE